MRDNFCFYCWTESKTETAIQFLHQHGLLEDRFTLEKLLTRIEKHFFMSYPGGISGHNTVKLRHVLDKLVERGMLKERYISEKRYIGNVTEIEYSWI